MMTETIPKNMRAAQLVEYKKYEINEVSVPEIRENDLLIKVGAASFCHTDYQVWEGVYGSPCPMVPSHETVGTIVAVGSQAQSKWSIGQRIGMICFRHACHTCVACKATGDIRFCEAKDIAGITADGGMAEYAVADGDNAVLLPDSISFEQAAPLMCAGATTFTALRQSEAKPTEAIGILGIGGLGTLAVQFAKAIGYKVVAIDNRPEGRELARHFKLKADLVLDPNDTDAVSKVIAFSGGLGLAGVITCMDDVPGTTWSTKLLRPNGVCVVLGVPPSGFQFDAFDTIFKTLTIKGSLVATHQDVVNMMKLVDGAGIESHITTLSLDRVPDLPKLYSDPHLRGRFVVKLD